MATIRKQTVTTTERDAARVVGCAVSEMARMWVVVTMWSGRVAEVNKSASVTRIGAWQIRGTSVGHS